MFGLGQLGGSRCGKKVTMTPQSEGYRGALTSLSLLSLPLWIGLQSYWHHRKKLR